MTTCSARAEATAEIRHALHRMGSATRRQASGGPSAEARPATKSCMIGPVGASSNELYEAVVALSRSIAGRTDLDALVSGVATSLRRIVRFDHVGLVLHDPNGNVMQGYILNEPCNPVITRLRLPVD